MPPTLQEDQTRAMDLATFCYQAVPLITGRRQQGNDDVIKVLAGVYADQIAHLFVEVEAMRGKPPPTPSELLRLLQAPDVVQFRYRGILEALQAATDRRRGDATE